MKTNTNNLAIIAFLVSAFIWGVTLPLMKVNLNHIPPLTMAFFRFTIALIISLIFLEFRGLKIKDFIHIGFYAFFGITLNVGFLLLGLERTTAIDATFLLALSPIITSILAIITLKEKINSIHLFGILLAFFGSFIYLVVPNIASGKNLSGDLLGELLIFFAIISSGIYVIGSKKLFRIYHPYSIASVSFFVGVISFFPITVYEYIKDPSWVDNINLFNIGSVLFLGIFSSFVAFSTLQWGLSKLDIHINEVISYLTPLISIIISTIFLAEKLDLFIFVISFSLIVIGIYLVSRFKPKTHVFNHHIHKV